MRNSLLKTLYAIGYGSHQAVDAHVIRVASAASYVPISDGIDAGSTTAASSCACACTTSDGSV